MNLGFRGVLVLGVVVGMPVASYFLVFKPQNRAIDAAKEEVEHKEALLSKLQAETARNADLVRANEEIQKSVKMIEARLPSGKEVDALVRQVSDIAVTSGLEPPAIKSAKPVPAAAFMEQPLEMEVSGPYAGFFAFIAQVEKLPRITRIHDLKISGVTKEESPDYIRAAFTLSIYFQDETQLAQGDTK